MRQSYLLFGASLVLAIAACDQSTAPSKGISLATANKLAADMDAVATPGTADIGLGATFSVGVGAGGTASATVIPINNTFTFTHQCPKGGSVALAGTVVGTGDRTTHSLTLDAEATRTDKACAFDTEDGILTLDGSIKYKGHLNIVNGVPVGLQTQSHEGNFHWARPGGSGDCFVKVASSYDPATHTVTVIGEFCGHPINVTRTRGG
jgi:hypothetical protein